MIPKTKARNAFPGDVVLVLTQSATDTQGREWKKGETLTPLSSGYDNTHGCQYMQTTTGARFEQ
jgi:hypothetical protein